MCMFSLVDGIDKQDFKTVLLKVIAAIAHIDISCQETLLRSNLFNLMLSLFRSYIMVS